MDREKKKTTAIVLAAGQGRRMGTKIQKQFLDLQGRPLVTYALEVFERADCVDEILLVTQEEMISYCQTQIVEKYGFSKVKKVLAGGKERYHSVYEGLKVCENTSYVLIHDGARPFLTEEMLQRLLCDVKVYGAAIAAMPVKDTIKIADEEQNVAATPPRSSLWQIQTPQVFDYALVWEAYDRLMKSDCTDITDDAMVVERMLGKKVHLTQGSYRNIKVTTPEDLEIAEAFMAPPLYSPSWLPPVSPS